MTLGLFWSTSRTSGPLISIEFEDGHGIKAGDALKHKGIDIGQVETVSLLEDLSKVIVKVRLANSAREIAREGTRFWIERPRVSIESVGGLDTILGAKYLSVLPGPEGSSFTSHFVALEVPPLSSPIPGSLEIFLDGQERYGLSPNAPIVFRGYRIGSVIEIGLASDAKSVRARCAIDPEYRQLIRVDTKFWKHSGWSLNVGLSGIALDAETIPQLLTGSIELATPSSESPLVRTGHHFQLFGKPESEWRNWSPSIGYGLGWNERLGEVPQPIRIASNWNDRILGFKSSKQIVSWCVPIDSQSVLCLRSFARTSGDSHRPDASEESGAARLGAFELGGELVPWTHARWREIGDGAVDEEDQDAVVLLSFDAAPLAVNSPKQNWRSGTVQQGEPVDVVVIRESALGAIQIDKNRLSGGSQMWKVDSSVSISDQDSGAPVVDASTGALIGLLKVDRRQSWIVRLPAELPGPN